ncbi:trans-Golgi network-localized SYP41-interacting protein 1 isoform X2 [Vigna angularis]|uniref:trans-Golgi network-localized SYP41-interacting protein 1 isoform X2 n=1 Tax=Phaseolus angularis TaxID=3914 RepID=UPI000809B010|nr:trans-Golgi network-localized SYP41-interacting protein 1 isoform X2 [Vigna angularis]
MDRNKSRTDLLAAGKKRLQQFRQKKDNKSGSSRGKSSKKAGLPQLVDSDSDAASSVSVSTVSSQITDGNVEDDSHSNVVNTEASESQSVANSLPPDNIDPSVVSSSVVTTYNTGDESVLDSNAELLHQVPGICEKDNESSAQVHGNIAEDIEADVAENVSLSTSGSLVPEGGETHDHASAPVSILSQPAPGTTVAGQSVSEREGEKRAELLLLSQGIPNTSVMQTREDQVTDLGAMQEADGLVMEKFCQPTDLVIDGQRELLLSEVGESDQSLPGISLEKARIEDASHEAEQLSESIEFLSSQEDILSDKLSGFDEGQGDDIAASGTSVRNLEREVLPSSYHEEIPLQCNQEQNSEVVLIEHDGGLQEGFNQQCPHDGLAIEDPKSRGAHEFDPSRPLDVPSVFDANSINLLQLAEIIRGLSEEECQFLIEARGVESDLDPLASRSILLDHDISEAFQSLKEELFLENLMKNIFNTQLAELLESDNQGQQLVDEIYQLRASYNEVNGKNQYLSEELDNCRVDLHDISSKNVELQNQFNAAMAEVEALSARVVELQNNFDMSQKDSLELSKELADCRGLISSLQVEKKGMNETLDSTNDEKSKLLEEKESHLFEIKNLESELADLKISMEGVKLEKSNLVDRISSVTEDRSKIEGEVEHLKHEIDRLSLDLVESKDLVASLQAENSNLNGNLAFSDDKIKNLVDENHSLSSQIIALNEQLSIEKGERFRFEGDLKEASLQLEQISKENVFLNNTLGMHKTQIEDTGKEHSQPLSQPRDLGRQANVVCEQSKGVKIAITEDSLHIDQEPDEGAPVGPHLNRGEREVFDDDLGFVSLKDCLDEAEKVLTMLENAVNELHSHSVSSSRSGEKVSSPVVSKLIQAFESKGHEDEHEGETRDSNFLQSSSNSFKLTKEQIESLKILLSKWKLDVQIAGALFKGERDDRKAGDAKYSDLEDQFEQLKQHCSGLEASNIELAVQYETVKQLLGDIQEKKFLLEELCDTLKQEDARLKAKNNELYEKLGHCQSTISELHTEMNDVKQISSEMASSLGSQLENLQKELTERAMLLEQGWNISMAQIVELVGKLKESVGGVMSTTFSSDTHSNLDITHQLEVSVHAAAEMIFDLQKKLESTYSEHEIMSTSYKEMSSKCDDLLGRNELAVSLLHKMYSDLRKLVVGNGTTIDDKIDVHSEVLPELLNYDSFQPILKHIGNILNEKQELESVTKEMKSEFMHRETELEELKLKCVDLDSVSKLIQDLTGVLNADIPKLDMNKSPLSWLDSLVSSLVQKMREAEIQHHTTKELYGSKEMELAELKEKMHYLDTLRLENENEILVLKESLYQAEEALVVARSELHKKANELEHSEQRVSSVREKLSIAVTKGKGLVVQRDGLKQSLAETSSELERCLQELQLKDTRLHEVETKLKTYEEAGERVEALESELSYIRNSSNALRESFLLKDSMLQRIEEILEDLDLPEQFHSRDTIEKIDWLASSVSGNSLAMNDWEQKDGVAVGSYSDAGYVARDSWKDDSQLQPDSDDFRMKFEELQSKYYGLAEQNEMLEQSLMERNSLLRRWEELVNSVEMPSHLQSMETEDKIECICAALTEANHHIDALQLKIEKYDSYCGMLNTDLEESQRMVSAFQEDLSALTSERVNLSEKVESLLLENERLSLQKREAELEKEKLIKEMTIVKDELEHKTAIKEQLFTTDGKIRKLQDLVVNTLSESDTQNMGFGDANIDSLEELLGKLIEKLKMEQKLSASARETELENGRLLIEITGLKDKLEHKTAIEEQIFTIDGKIRKLQVLVGDALSESDTQNMVFGDANIDSLEELLRKLIEKLKMEQKLSALTRETELENEMLLNEITSLKDKLENKTAIEEQIFTVDGKIRKLQDLVGDALSESDSQNIVSDNAPIDSLEELLGKLIEKLNMERKLSVLTRETELENEKLLKEITSLKDKLEHKTAIEEQIFTLDGKIRKLQDLVGDALSKSDSQNMVSGNEPIDSLEELLGKLIENLKTEQKLSAHTRETELENEKLLNEIANLMDKLEQKAVIEEQIFIIDDKIRKLHDLVCDALPGSETENLVSGSEKIDSLEELLRKLLQNHANLLSMNPAYGVVGDGLRSQKDDGTLCEERSIDVQDKEASIDRYKIDLEKSLNELLHVKEERDRSLDKQISLSGEVEAMTKRIEGLQGLLNQEEHKSASLREKLNVAVRKGKSLVQQRDSLKHTIEEMSVQMEHLKSEITNRDNTLAEHEQRLGQLSTYPDKLEALESESLQLKKHLEETEHHLQEQEYSLKLILNKLGEIEVGGEGYISDPVKKLEQVGKLCSDLHSTVASLEQESRKSKRASELLLAELNEVQERNDSFQEELAKMNAELVDIRRERDSAEASKLEALAHLEKLSSLHEAGKHSHLSDIMELKSNLNLVFKSFGEVHNLLTNAFIFDLESYRKLEAGLESCMKVNSATNMVDSSITKEHWASSNKGSVPAHPWQDFDAIDQYDTSVENLRLFCHQLQQFITKVSSLKEKISIHSSLAQELDKTLSKLMASIQREMTSQKESCETMKKELSEHDEKLVAFRGIIAYLYEACNNSSIVLENEKAELSGTKVESSDLGMSLETPLFDDDISEEYIKTMADRLLLTVKGFTSIKAEFLDANKKEMKSTIANLQRELQEKDVQRDRICSDLVKQIKDAEAAATSYSQDLEAFKIQEHNLKKEVEAIEAERKILEQKVNELQDRQETTAELEDKMRSQTTLLAAKDQEIEALMHALDEEETQMEELTNKIVDLEKVVEQKNQEIENLEFSRGKVMKKLSITVSKFDELHHLSANLLSEVEKLQSQLQERDTEISFLRQEVTRCTNDVLLASQMSNQRSSDEIFEFLTWVDMVVSHDGAHDIHPDMKSNSQVHECKEILQKKLMSLLSELENLREVVESKDAMLQVERSKVEELNHKTETLETSLHQKELQLNLLEGVEETSKGAGTSSEIVEVEPVMNRWSPSGAFVAPQVRSLRKGNSDHIAIAVDENPGGTSRIEEEDDKVHGFKSLTSSKIVPRFTRPLTDLIDGLWVSCDRTLMRQPVLRLGIILYWAIMHALLAFFVV